MKTVTKTLAGIACAFASLQALAFTPPYHVEGTTFIGTATFKSTGSCKVAPKKFINAQYGTVKDSASANVGYAVISADGAVLLAVQNNAYGYGYSKYIQGHNLPGKSEYTTMSSFINGDVMQYIATEAGCLPVTLWATPASNFHYLANTYPIASGSKLNINIKQSFIGYVAPSPALCPEVNNVTKCKSLKFSGLITFQVKGYVVP